MPENDLMEAMGRSRRHCITEYLTFMPVFPSLQAFIQVRGTDSTTKNADQYVRRRI